jgi:sRNA-binding carbon storage regulator CsrA
VLTLERKEGEAVILKTPDGFTIALAVLTPGRTKLGFEAPKDVTILREELAPPTEALDKLKASQYRRKMPR